MSNIFVCLSASIECGKSSINQIVDYIGKNNHTLIYGGGKRGAMGQLSSGVAEYETPQKVYTIKKYLDDVPDYKNTTVTECPNLLHRLEALITSADVAVVYPGGLGTAQELMTLLEWSRAVKHIPIVVINENGHYDWLVALFDSWNRQGYTDKHVNNFCMVVNDFKDAVEFIDSICQ